MKRILLVTLYDETNYGNRLQNYALQTTLSNMGYSVDNLVVKQMARTNAVERTKLAIKHILVACGGAMYTDCPL